MNVFVIGATGFVGGAVARHLADNGHTVTGLARTETAAATLDDQGITPVTGDLDACRPATIEAALRADARLHPEPTDTAPPARRLITFTLDGRALP